MTSSQSEVLANIFGRIVGKTEEVRQAAAIDLRDHVITHMHESAAGEDTAKGVWAEVFIRTFDLTRSNNFYERMGAIQAIEALSEASMEEIANVAAQRNARLYEYLRPLLNCSDSTVMIYAAHCLGNMIKLAGPTLGDSFFIKEAGQQVQQMDDSRQEVGRFSAVLILHQFASNAPGQFYPFVLRTLEKIWVPLRDTRVMVRERASMLLVSCLDIVRLREKNPTETYRRIFEEARSGLQKGGSVDSILGSLLAIASLLAGSQMFMIEFYQTTCELVLKYKDNKDVGVRKHVITLIPSMATYDSQAFVTHYMHRGMAYLLQSLGKPTDRDFAYIAIGHLAVHLQSEMKPFIEDIIKIVKEHLRMRGKKNAPPESPIFQCVAMLATAVGPNLTRYMHDLLDLMFPCGLSEALRQALLQISVQIPPLLRTIQERLLDAVAMILSGRPFKPLGAPAPRGDLMISRDLNMLHSAQPETIALALHILGTFDFSGHTLNEFVRDCALPYLEHDSPTVRQEAVLASCQLFVHDPICHQTSSHSIEIVNDVLDKLLTVGITDPSPIIRRTVLEKLDEKFDRHLAQADSIRSLFVALNDEVFQNRELAIMIIGRLAVHNPAYVMPSLRTSLIKLITELEYSTANKQKEDSAKLLCLLIGASSSLIKSYASTILSVLMRTAKAPDTPSSVVAQCLISLGELARVAGEEITREVDEILNLVIDMLADQTSTHKRDAALKTLGQVVSNTGAVITPYIDHPTLLGSLFRLLRTEVSPFIRLETIRTMGMLGALDPFKHKLLQGGADDPNAETSGPRVTDITLLMNINTPSNDEYYQTVVVNSLVGVLQDTSLTSHHYAAVESVMLIFRTQRLRCVSFLPQILPAFLGVIRLAPRDSQEVFLKQLANLINIVKQHIRNYLGDVFALVHEFWNPNSSLQLSIISLVEAVARAVEGEFKAYLPRLLQETLRSFDSDLSAKHLSDKRLNTLLHLLKAFYTFGSSIEDYLHLVLPVIVRSFETPDAPQELRTTALKTIAQLCRKVNFCDHASQIIHPLARTLASGDDEVRTIAMETLCVLVLQFGPDFAIFIPMINKCLIENKISHTRYEQLVTKLLNRERLPPDLGPVERFAYDQQTEAVSAEQNKLPVNQQQLKLAWNCSHVTTRAEWLEWIRKLGTEFMRESPSQAIRASRGLAEVYYPFARELFNVAFVSCWGELYDTYQEDLVHQLEMAITSPGVPADVVNMLLNLAEFMEHDEKALAIEPRLLGTYAATFHAYAKSLHYKEMEFFNDPSSSVVEDLISVNQKLQQGDAAWGTLEYAQNSLGMSNDVFWYEELGRWEDALQVWNERALDPDGPFDETALAFGKLRCLHALGEWEQLSDFVQGRWVNAPPEERKMIAPLAAAASWSLYQWDLMDDYIAAMKTDSADRNFFKAIIAVHRHQFPSATKHINKAREKLDGELTSLTGESYGRAYDVVVRVQMLSELEEIITYKNHVDQPARQATQRKTWMNRLEGCQRDVEVWQRILQVRSLVLTPTEDIDTWIKFADLCRTSDRLTLAEKTLESLIGTSSIAGQVGGERAPPQVIFAYFKLLWAQGKKNSAVECMEHLAAQLGNDIGLNHRDQQGRLTFSEGYAQSDRQLLARCHVELGQWQSSLHGHHLAKEGAAEVLDHYSLATELDPVWYQAWHAWALANYDVITELEVSSEGLTAEHFPTYIIPAVESFLRSIALSPGNALQDTLRLLTLWFTYGYQQGVASAVAYGLRSVNIDVWLEVIPQIIARVQTPRAAIQQLIKQLLTDIGKAHPQALIYPLTVASKSQVASRREVALSVMLKMRDHSALIVDQAALVSTELIRAAILWHEQWHEGLEEASKFYFADHNPDGMFQVLEPLHDMVEKGPETLRETSFVQSFGHDLRAARDHCRRYKVHGDVGELNQAWDIYYAIFQRLAKQLKLLNEIDLQYVSPKLASAVNLELAMPGTYQSGKPIVRIQHVLPTFHVISSKQRPRRCSMKGVDGKEYMYLLKGHEDLRQDERVMQLFGLVNTLLTADQESSKRHLSIQRYSVVPLSPNSGLLGWVPHSDTLHVLIKNYRESRKILVDIEYRLMNQMADDNYDSLPLMHKVEVFQYALDNTTGQDLYRILWLRSRNSEAWLERRTTYTRSLGVNSMVGYILGLGDRHPSNLMLDQITGKVVHIDFGDCFEVAMQREKYPEKIPFRLTRMLIHAMEVCGLTGSFSRSCEVSMEVLRDNKESLMAVLEAFVYDPLIMWRLVTPTNQPGGVQDQTRDPLDDGRQAFLNRKTKADETEILNDVERPELRNDKALQVIDRVRKKLTGRDFKPREQLDVNAQVAALVSQAVAVENLCQCYVGWCSFW